MTITVLRFSNQNLLFQSPEGISHYHDLADIQPSNETIREFQSPVGISHCHDPCVTSLIKYPETPRLSSNSAGPILNNLFINGHDKKETSNGGICQKVLSTRVEIGGLRRANALLSASNPLFPMWCHTFGHIHEIIKHIH